MNKLCFPIAALLLAAVGCRQPAPDAGPDPKNEIPFGFVETPASPPGEAATVKKQLVVKGWAMDDQGVKEVRLFVDNKFVARTTVNQLREDVAYRRIESGMRFG